IFAQSNRLMYDEPIDIEVLSKRVGDIKQLYTQHAGVRPFGVSMIIGGIDETGSRILQTDPSGACWAYKAIAIGAGSDAVKELLEAKYRDDLKLDEALSLSIECLAKAMDRTPDPKEIRIVVIPTKTRKFTPLSLDEVSKLINK
ncbi:MAG: archaeal proteasome endopeptidase complex subunit alpha, partial [Candidatus Hermodarchaeia archaeon]